MKKGSLVVVILMVLVGCTSKYMVHKLDLQQPCIIARVSGDSADVVNVLGFAKGDQCIPDGILDIAEKDNAPYIEADASRGRIVYRGSGKSRDDSLQKNDGTKEARSNSSEMDGFKVTLENKTRFNYEIQVFQANDLNTPQLKEKAKLSKAANIILDMPQGRYSLVFYKQGKKEIAFTKDVDVTGIMTLTLSEEVKE